MAQLTTSSTVSSGMTEYYDRTLIMRALPYLPHSLFGQHRPLPSNTAEKIKFRKYNSLTKALVALTEGVTPTAQQLSITDIEATPPQYGSYVALTDKVQFIQPDAVLTETTELCGENMAETVDTIHRDILNAGTSVFYAGSLDTASIDTRAEVDENVTEATLRACVNTLRNAKAKYFTNMIKGSTGYATYPIAPSYWAIVHPNVVHDLEGLTNFRRIEEYAQHQEVHENEVGAIFNVRFVMSTEAKYWENVAESLQSNVYSTLIFGMNAYGVVPIDGHASQVIVKEKGSGGTSDPLNQRSTVGWVANTTARILTQTFMLRLESLASIGG